MPQVKISDIIATDRVREDLGEIEELAQSIRQHGLLQPILLSEDNTLIAGGRRLAAHKLLGHQTIEVVYKSDVDELSLREMELEENLQRKSFTWQEQVKAKEEIHRIKQDKHGAAKKGTANSGWGIKDTAQALDESTGSVSMDIQLAQGLDKYPELNAEKTKTRAYKQMKRLEEREVLAEITRRAKEQGTLGQTSLRHGNSLEGIRDVPDESVDLHLTDPPWGISIDTNSQLARKSALEYKDDQTSALAVIRTAAREIYRTLKIDGHVYFFFGTSLYHQTLQALVESGLIVDPIPCYWIKENAGSPSKGKRHPNQAELFFHAWKDDQMVRFLSSGRSNVFTYPRERTNKIHSAQKPQALLREIISISTNTGDTVCDMFAGSGATLVAARALERSSFGWELNEENYNVAQAWIQQQVGDAE